MQRRIFQVRLKVTSNFVWYDDRIMVFEWRKDLHSLLIQLVSSQTCEIYYYKEEICVFIQAMLFVFFYRDGAWPSLLSRVAHQRRRCVNEQTDTHEISPQLRMEHSSNHSSERVWKVTAERIQVIRCRESPSTTSTAAAETECRNDEIICKATLDRQDHFLNRRSYTVYLVYIFFFILLFLFYFVFDTASAPPLFIFPLPIALCPIPFSLFPSSFKS